MSVDSLSDHLLRWYDVHARDLPWRARPGAPPPDPYRVWLSEIMLQQTTVASVTPRFAAFVARWPTVDALAAASDEAVMQQWAGLGYYARARNLIACARIVAARGGFPDTEDALKALPGIGDYSAAAIAAIAFGRHAVVVDANIERVVSRLFAVAIPKPQSRGVIRQHMADITPLARAGDFAQAMMDLATMVCTPRGPRCADCPIAMQCAAWRAGNPQDYPRRVAKAARPERPGQAWWIERDGKALLVRRDARGLLGGMLALPSSGWDGSAVPPWLIAGDAMGGVRHIFTHFAADIVVRRATLSAGCVLPPNAQWCPLDRLDAAGLPALFLKAVRVARGEKAR